MYQLLDKSQIITIIIIFNALIITIIISIITILVIKSCTFICFRLYWIIALNELFSETLRNAVYWSVTVHIV